MDVVPVPSGMCRGLRKGLRLGQGPEPPGNLAVESGRRDRDAVVGGRLAGRGGCEGWAASAAATALAAVKPIFLVVKVVLLLVLGPVAGPSLVTLRALDDEFAAAGRPSLRGGGHGGGVGAPVACADRSSRGSAVSCGRSRCIRLPTARSAPDRGEALRLWCRSRLSWAEGDSTAAQSPRLVRTRAGLGCRLA